MSDELALAALFMGAASLLVIAMIFFHARHDPKPAPPVLYEDRKSWRREAAPFEGAWVHIAGALAVAIEIYWLAHAL